MPDPRRFRVGYLSHVPHPSFLETAALHPELEVVRIPLDQPESAVLDALRGVDAYYVMASRDELPKPFHVNAALLRQLPDLLMVGSTGAGYDTVDPGACTEAGVLLVNQAGGNAEGVAEHAVGMMLSLLKRMPEAGAAMRAGRARDRSALMGRELRGRTVGLVGIGNVGTRVAEIVRLGFSCPVLACDPYLDDATIAARGARKVEMPELLAESDVVSLHLPLSPESRNLLNGESFARMKPGAIFVTTARGNIHDEPALHAALRSGHLAGAGLDVWEQEPPPPEHPLLHMANVIVTQHTAGVTHESRANITRIAALAFADAAKGLMPPRIINPAVAPRFAERYAAKLGRRIA
ncbi:NAD(P)-dependent oxidoreductase [Roseicella sp. DB1501]|uniref:NAD(P)-dependent oxidoreductase n=1 Tax=Roseicella sp. DB1501 TaxID=2730925 RepID=UPI0034A01F01